MFCSLPALVAPAAQENAQWGLQEGSEPLQIRGGEQGLALGVSPGGDDGPWHWHRGQERV